MRRWELHGTQAAEASEPVTSYQRGAAGRCDEPRTPEVMQKHGQEEGGGGRAFDRVSLI